MIPLRVVAVFACAHGGFRLQNKVADLLLHSPRVAKAGEVLFLLKLGFQPFAGFCKILEGNIRPEHHILVAADAIHISVPEAPLEHGAGIIYRPVAVAVSKALVDPPQPIEVKTARAHRPFRAAEPIQHLVISDAVVAHVGDLFQQLRCVDILPQIFRTEKSMHFCTVVDRYGNEAVDALRMQPVVHGAAGGVVLDRIHIRDHTRPLAGRLKGREHRLEQFHRDILHELLLGYRILSAHLKDDTSSPAVSRESQHIGPVRVVIRPHRIHHAFGVTAADHLLHAA